MSTTTVTPAPEDAIVRKKLGFGFWLCVIWVGLMAFIAIFAPVLPLKSPTANFINSAQGRPPYAPSWSHWFGTDKDARDVFSRSLYGARISLTVGFTAITAGFLIGGSLGVISGYYKG
jgi:peptide/nickel transport system permease protein